MAPDSTSPEQRALDTWHALTAGSQPTLLAALRAQYGAAGRHYHSLAHVGWVLARVLELVHELEPHERESLDLAAIQLAVLCHDVVYDTDATRHAAQNEAESAAFAVACAGALGWAPERQALVERLVLATADHRPADLPEAVVVDADLAVLGASPAEYDAYVAAVRREYRQIDDHHWRVGRAAVLERLTGSSSIFTTAPMRAARERAARANLQRELAALRAEPTPTTP